MKISKKIMLLIIPVLLLASSCGIFKGEGHCDCPKFSDTPSGQENPDDAGNS